MVNVQQGVRRRLRQEEIIVCSEQTLGPPLRSPNSNQALFLQVVVRLLVVDVALIVLQFLHRFVLEIFLFAFLF
jgi:hypothetical protein